MWWGGAAAGAPRLKYSKVCSTLGGHARRRLEMIATVCMCMHTMRMVVSAAATRGGRRSVGDSDGGARDCARLCERTIGASGGVEERSAHPI